MREIQGEPLRSQAKPTDVTVVGRSFEQFYADEYATVAKALIATLGDRDLGLDATDEAMARAYLNWSKIQSYDNVNGWVYRVGFNWATSLRKKLTRQLPLQPTTFTPLDAVGDPAVEDALRALNVKARSVVACRLLLDWSVEETAEALSISPGTVKSRLHRALKQLERTLGPDHRTAPSADAPNADDATKNYEPARGKAETQ